MCMYSSKLFYHGTVGIREKCSSIQTLQVFTMRSLVAKLVKVSDPVILIKGSRVQFPAVKIHTSPRQATHLIVFLCVKCDWVRSMIK